MINTNITNLLQSIDEGEFTYSILINKINQEPFCNKDQINFTVNQVTPSLYQIIKQQQQDIDVLKETLTTNNITIPELNNTTINNVIEKNFIINSSLDFNNTTSMFTSKLTGSLSGDKNIEIPDTEITKQATSKYIECAIFPISKEVTINFLNKYPSLPNIVPTIDEDNKVYSTYSLSFKQDSNNNYTGVTITFNDLKKQKRYGDISVLIIGDKIDQTNDG